MMYFVELLFAVAVAGTPEVKQLQFRQTELKVGILLDTSTEDSVGWWLEETARLRGLVNVSVSNTTLVWRRVGGGSKVLAVRAVCDLLNSGIHMLVTAVRCPQLMTVSAMTETLRIPHLAVGIDPCVLPHSTYTIHRSHPRRYAGIVLRDTVRTLGWKKLMLISAIGSIDKGALVQMSLAGVEIVLGTIEQLKTENWPPGQNNMVVITSSKKLPTLLYVLNTSKTLDLAYHCILLTVDEITQVTWMEIRSHPIGNTFLLEPMNQLTAAFSAALQSVSDVVGFDNRTCDAKCGPEENVSLSGCGANSIKKADGIYYYDNAMGCDAVQYRLSRMYRDGSGWLPALGTWTPDRGLRMTRDARHIFQDKRHDFDGRKLRVAVVPTSTPFTFKDKDTASYIGLVIDMMNDLAALLNFRYQIVESVDGLYGHRLDNGSWTGAIGMAQRHEIDITAGVFTVTPERVQVVDFSLPFIQDGHGILTPRPVDKVDQFQVFRPFSLEVWIAIVASIFIVTFLLTFLNRCSSQQIEGESVCNAFFVVISSYFEQGSASYPTATSARCLLGAWLVFSLLTTSFYTAVLVSVLTVSTPARPINSLEDLAERDDMGVIVNYGTSIWDLFQNSDLPVYQRIKPRIRPSDFIEQALPSIRSGGYSFIGDRSSLRFQAAQNCAKTRLATDTFQSFSLALVLPKNSPYKAGIDTSIQKMVESGVISKLENRWLAPPKNCAQDIPKTGLMLDMDRMRGIFLVFCGVAVFAAICCLGELLLVKIIRSKRGKRLDSDGPRKVNEIMVAP